MLNPHDVSKLYFEKNLSEFEGRFGLRFKDKALLITALSHRSALSAKVTSKEENGRLALMGDKLIDLLLYRIMFDKKTTLQEMNAARTHTEDQNLDKVARRLGIEKYLFLEDSADEEIRERSVSFGADSLEGLVGAIFVDSGFDAAHRFFNNWVLSLLLTD
jgi:ribonuclease-3